MIVGQQNELSLRPVSESDIPWLVALRQETMGNYLNLSGMSTSQQDLLNRVLFNFKETQIIQSHRKDIGMIKLVREESCWNLIQLQIVPAFQEKGIGTTLIKNLIAEARQADASVILSVLKKNPVKSLYEKLGFQVIAEDEHSYKMQIKKEE